VCLVSRQRLIGRTNGSSTYLLAIVDHLRRAGIPTDLVQPSPVVMGRWPIMRLSPDMAVFASIKIRGALRIGDLVLSTNPGLYLAGARAAAATLLRRAGVSAAWIDGRKAPFSIAAPFEKADYVYMARRTPPDATRILLDYAFQAELLPYCLRPDARSGVVMHDLFSARPIQFKSIDAADSVAVISAETEARYLSRCGVIFAIQEEEAQWVLQHAPGAEVIVTPMAAETRGAAAPGRNEELLFVGSNTAPNTDGLQWFFDAVWPLVLAKAPGARLTVAGSVSRGVSRWPQNVRSVGVVPSLSDYYADAGVVISPLRAGSGLKIKLIEALAAGKAIVATSVTLQGVADVVGGAVEAADAPEPFAAAILRLLNDPDRRQAMGDAALEVARGAFGAKTSYGGVLAWTKAP